MANLAKLRGEQIKAQIAGNEMNGIMIDSGKDMMVLYNGNQYLYIPLSHIHRIQKNSDQSDYVDVPSGSPVTKETESLSYQEVLTNAKETPIEIFISREISFSGYITNVLDDYFVFYSPVYKMVYIPIRHFKWLIPYNPNITLYSIKNSSLTVQNSPLHQKVIPSNIPLLSSLEDQLKKEAGKLIIFDGGTDPMKVGLLENVINNFAEIVSASGETASLNLSHIKSIQLP